MKLYTICPVCIAVSGTWLTLSFLAAWEYVALSAFLIPISLLMGGTVVGISSRCRSLFGKAVVVLIGLPLAYFFITHLTKMVVALEFALLVIIAFIVFSNKDRKANRDVGDLEKKMKQCC